MSHSTNKTIQTGVAVVIAVVLAVVGVGVIDSADLTEVLSVDSQTEWDNNGTFSGVVSNSSGYIQLDPGNNSGTYTFDTFSNESDVTRVVVTVDQLNETNASVQLTANGDTYDLTEGTNRLDVSGGSSYELSLSRDDGTVDSPRVSSASFLAGSTGSLLRLVGLAAFGLLLLLVVVNQLGQGLNVGRGM